MSAHDRHLAAFGMRSGEVECPVCERMIAVTLYREYGQSWLEPEDCPHCAAPLGDVELQEFEPPERD